MRILQTSDLTSATVVCDSVSAVTGSRLTTFRLVFPRFILPQVNTHRVFSRNTASSRAVPVWRNVKDVIFHPYTPSVWGLNKPGMVAGESSGPVKSFFCDLLWHMARIVAVAVACMLILLRIHKQYVNRVLEPWMWSACILSSTEFDNWFSLRLASDAQPEIQMLAIKMTRAMEASTPSVKYPGEWHTPFVYDEDLHIDQSSLNLISAVRCARVTFNRAGVCKSRQSELGRAEEMLRSRHFSPFEHVAYVPLEDTEEEELERNYRGWHQLRAVLDGDVPARQADRQLVELQ